MLVNLGSDEQPRWIRIAAIDSVEYSETGGCLVTLRSGQAVDCPHSVAEVIETMQQADPRARIHAEQVSPA